MTVITNAAALEKINAAVSGGVETDWIPMVDALRTYFSKEGTFNLRWSDLDLHTLVKNETGVAISQEFAFAALDIIRD